MKSRRVYILENEHGQILYCDNVKGAELVLLFPTKAEAKQFLDAELEWMPPKVVEQKWRIVKKWLGDKNELAD
jgi:hypothetical protein